MALHYMTYLEIPPRRRAAAAGDTLRHLKAQLSDSTLSDEQRAKVLAKAERLNNWVLGTTEVEDVAGYQPADSPRGKKGDVVPKKKVDHEVEVTEEVVVIEGD